MGKEISLRTSLLLNVDTLTKWRTYAFANNLVECNPVEFKPVDPNTFDPNLVCLQKLFQYLGFHKNVLSTVTKRYIKKAGIEDSKLTIMKNKKITGHYVNIESSWEIISLYRDNHIVYSVGVRDVDFPVKVNGKLIPSYRKWCGMLERCYSDKWHIKKPSYKDCTVCDDWKRFSCFHEWFVRNNVEGYVLDKDILDKSNKVYSPEKCVFVPDRINGLLISRGLDRGPCPQGVIFRKDRRSRPYEASITKDKKRIHLGFFDTLELAFVVYKKAKEDYIKEVAEEYFGKELIGEDVYGALLKYKVDIND